eukprot:1792733-Prymnesium_polylepis.1
MLLKLRARGSRELQAWRVLIAEGRVHATCELKKEGDSGLDTNEKADDKRDEVRRLAVVALLAELHHLAEQLTHCRWDEVRGASAFVEQASIRCAQHLLLILDCGHMLR